MFPEAQDLILKLLESDPKTRLENAKQIKQHKYFKGIDW